MAKYNEENIQEFILRWEGVDIEFKGFGPEGISKESLLNVVNGIAKTISSFSNTNGGVIIVGVNNNPSCDPRKSCINASLRLEY